MDETDFDLVQEACECGELLYTDCNGGKRCELCDPPCPSCSDQ